MKHGTYQLLGWNSSGQGLTIETDDGQLTVNRQDVQQGNVTIAVDDRTPSVIIDHTGTTILSHAGDISSMRFGLGLPELPASS